MTIHDTYEDAVKYLNDNINTIDLDIILFVDSEGNEWSASYINDLEMRKK